MSLIHAILFTWLWCDMTKEEILDHWSNGDLSRGDAIVSLEELGYSHEEAEQLLDDSPHPEEEEE